MANEILTMTLDEYQAQAGKLCVTSDWFIIDQQRIDGFADVTQDYQFIHVDPEKAKNETAFGGTIAHGFLSLSMLSAMIAGSFPTLEGVAMSINYGFDKIRFLTPVASGARIRAVINLSECSERKPGELLSKYDVTVEIEGEEKPALVAQWLGLAILEQEEA